MRAVMPEIRPEILEWRRRTGADRWDEMWDGELHAPPMPTIEHQDFTMCLGEWLSAHWKRRQQGNKIHPPVNVASPGGWPKDYRIPDLVLVTLGSRGVDRGEYYEGPGWISSAATGVQLRPAGGRLFIEMINDPHTGHLLPGD